MAVLLLQELWLTSIKLNFKQNEASRHQTILARSLSALLLKLEFATQKKITTSKMYTKV